MADIADLTGAGRSDVIPGNTLAPLTLLDFGEMERAFEARHIARASAAAAGLSPEAAAQTNKLALDDVRRGMFGLGSPEFNVEALRVQNLPFLAWLELRRFQPGTTQDRATQLLRECPDLPAAQDAILTLAGYPKKKKPVGQGAGTPSSGENSSDSSETPDSATAKSAA